MGKMDNDVEEADGVNVVVEEEEEVVVVVVVVVVEVV